MRYQFNGDKLELINYIIKYKDNNFFIEDEDNNVIYNKLLIIDKEKLISAESSLIDKGIEYIIEEIDNSNYEWLNNKVFTNNQRLAGYVRKAIELGEEGYNSWLILNDESKKTQNNILSLEDEISTTQFILADIIMLMEE